jgi:hypothetical protein
MRHLSALMALILVAGCAAAPVTVQNPRTGETAVCSKPYSEWNPWSQHEACIAAHIAEGWVVVR